MAQLCPTCNGTATEQKSMYIGRTSPENPYRGITYLVFVCKDCRKSFEVPWSSRRSNGNDH